VLEGSTAAVALGVIPTYDQEIERRIGDHAGQGACRMFIGTIGFAYKLLKECTIQFRCFNFEIP
jgi:hypothetical protein